MKNENDKKMNINKITTVLSWLIGSYFWWKLLLLSIGFMLSTGALSMLILVMMLDHLLKEVKK